MPSSSENSDFLVSYRAEPEVSEYERDVSTRRALRHIRNEPNRIQRPQVVVSEASDQVHRREGLAVVHVAL